MTSVLNIDVTLVLNIDVTSVLNIDVTSVLNFLSSIQQNRILRVQVIGLPIDFRNCHLELNKLDRLCMSDGGKLSCFYWKLHVIFGNIS